MESPKVTEGCLRVLYQNSLRAVPLNFILSTFLVINFVYHNAFILSVMIWWGLIIVINIFRYAHIKILERKPQPVRFSKRSLQLFLLMTFLSAAVWGSCYFLFMNDLGGMQLVLVVLALGGNVVGSIASLSAYLPAFYSYLIPQMAPMMFYYYYLFTLSDAFFATIILVFIVIMFVVSRLNHNLIVNNISLSFRKDELLKELSSSHEQLKSAFKQIEKLSYTDPLTNLPNRRYFDETLPKVWDDAVRRQHSLSLLMVDVDNFKFINDTYGHPYGDKFLMLVAKVLESGTHNVNAIVARLGGDEFAILLPSSNLSEAKAVAEEVQSEYLRVSTKSDKVSLSIGVCALTPKPESSVQDMINYADQALYDAKEQGKNTIVIANAQ